jgi:hypothetical protein
MASADDRRGYVEATIETKRRRSKADRDDEDEGERHFRHGQHAPVRWCATPAIARPLSMAGQPASPARRSVTGYGIGVNLPF